jgi:CMP/dCMP kinase
MIIAIDGTTASGKGTLAKRLAAHYGLPHLDTGLLYRAVGLAGKHCGLDPDDGHGLSAIASLVSPDHFREEDLRTAETGQLASRAAALKGVRAALFQAQRAFALQPGGAVLDGRDIGTVIAPEADVKLYVDAARPERARRRGLELAARGQPVDLDVMIAELAQRDSRDAERADAPAKPAENAHLLDTTELSIDDAFQAARSIIDQTRAEKAKR